MQASLQQQVLADVLVPRFGAQTRMNGLIRDAVLVVGFAVFMAICAQIAIRLPNTPVPITGQTFGALVAGGALGSRRGGLSMALYMVVGLIGVPVFAASGVCATGDGTVLSEVGACYHFVFPWSGSDGLIWNMFSGGYILGFILAAYLTGYLAERGWVRRSSLPLAMLLGNIVIYVFGLPWLAWQITSNDIPNVLSTTLQWGLFPFIGGDAIKLMAASLLLPGAWAVVDMVKGKPPEE